jgi:hypothetical protein
MRAVKAVLVLLVCVASPNLRAQTKEDEEAVRKLPQIHCDAWNKHDAICPITGQPSLPFPLPASPMGFILRWSFPLRGALRAYPVPLK